MIRFLTLGTTDFEADDPASAADALISQPKRLALLAFLAVDRPGSRHFRDALSALFWPELDADRARHALRQALYHLRGTLGPGVLLGEDHAGVGIARERLWCDAVAFEAEVDCGRLVHALDLYGGEFMPGFHSECGPGFELWLDTVRRRLERKAVAAAWSLADGAEARGDMREACAWARRVVDLQPYHERGGLRLARLLGSSGQRVEAARMLDGLVDRLEAEGFEPAAETRDMAHRIRRGDPEELTGHYRGDEEPAGAVPTPAIGALAVLPFTPLSGSDEETVFADGLTEMVITELVQHGCPSVLSRTSVLAYRNRDRSLPAVARELGADYVMEGSVTVDADRVRVTVQLLAVGPERHLWAACFERPFCDPLALQAELAAASAEAATAALDDHRGRAAEAAPAGGDGD